MAHGAVPGTPARPGGAHPGLARLPLPSRVRCGGWGPSARCERSSSRGSTPIGTLLRAPLPRGSALDLRTRRGPGVLRGRRVLVEIGPRSTSWGCGRTTGRTSGVQVGDDSFGRRGRTRAGGEAEAVSEPPLGRALRMTTTAQAPIHDVAEHAAAPARRSPHRRSTAPLDRLSSSPIDSPHGEGIPD